MAYNAMMLPNVAAVTTELWPSVANTVMVPWKSSTSPISRRSRNAQVATPAPSTDAKVQHIQQVTEPHIPEFLRNVTLRALNSPTAPDAMVPTTVQTTIANLTRVGLHAANPVLRRPYFQPAVSASPSFVRPFMRSTPGLWSSSRSISTFRAINTQQRGFGTSNGISRNQLASLEESANRNPGNANAQNAFYQLLLRANMPAILVERYQSNRFATNPGTDDAYRKALGLLGAGVNNAANASAAGSYGRTQWPTFEQAVGNAAVAGSGAAGNGMGHKGEPIHVIVQESTRSVVFRWFKFLATFLVVTYLCFAAVTILIETLSTFRRGPGHKQDSEVKAEKQTTTFNDVHGCDEAKEELQEVVEFLKNPEKFTDLGAKLPKGVLLVGPPGTGKTLLARAVAGEAGVPFFYMSGSEFDEIFVGVGAKRVRELFAAAKSKSPAIVFIDELDAIGGKRNPRDQAHAKQTLNQLLTELDGFDQETKIIIIGATNLPKMLDKALIRPGRFDRHVNVDLPDVRGRIAILKHHAKKIKVSPDVDLEAIAARCPGQSGAELENMLNVAALRASRAKAKVVSKNDLDWAFDRVTMGSERKSMVVTEKEKEMTAYHEAGHALVQLFDKESSNTLYKVTILPKGPSLGHTAQLPQMDKYSYTAAEYMSNIRVLLGGKMAEEMRYGGDKVTSGVSSDLERATDLSYMMVTLFGMSSALGPVEYGRRYENLSSETKAAIEGEVQKQLRKSYEDVRTLLTEKRNELDLLAKALVRYETLDKSEVEKVIRGENLPGRITIPKGPLTLPIPDQVQPPGLGGIAQPQPPESPPPAAAADTSNTNS
ncbi:P-loop containing nucleoside triphosphate hydrolase protein [Ilyonectria sp. MPI-CAGE-AT-0026]|nr:P-loop containing nucleoside triphosphate hydrolase protein [Ilyonectria sp. MPI-CAGE-AT-0026]